MNMTEKGMAPIDKIDAQATNAEEALVEALKSLPPGSDKVEEVEKRLADIRSQRLAYLKAKTEAAESWSGFPAALKETWRRLTLLLLWALVIWSFIRIEWLIDKIDSIPFGHQLLTR